MPDTEEPTVDDATRAADERDAQAAHRADRMPTPEEEAAAPDQVDRSVIEHEQDMARKGANVKGEGQIDA